MARFITIGLVLLITACTQTPVKEVKNVLEQQVEADRFYANKQCDKAIPLYLDIADAVSLDTKSLLRVGNCQVRAGKYNAAELTYQRALARDPENAKLWYNLSYVRARMLAKTVSMMYEHVPASSPEAEKVRALTIEVLAPFDLNLDTEAE